LELLLVKNKVSKAESLGLQVLERQPFCKLRENHLQNTNLKHLKDADQHHTHFVFN